MAASNFGELPLSSLCDSQKNKTNAVDTSTSVMVDTITSVITVVRLALYLDSLNKISPVYSEFRLEWIKEKGGGFKFQHPKDTRVLLTQVLHKNLLE